MASKGAISKLSFGNNPRTLQIMNRLVADCDKLEHLSRKIRVVTWNVSMALGDISKAAPAGYCIRDKAKAITDTILETCPSILCLQETEFAHGQRGCYVRI
jgi:hypothetical protein